MRRTNLFVTSAIVRRVVCGMKARSLRCALFTLRALTERARWVNVVVYTHQRNFVCSLSNAPRDDDDDYVLPVLRPHKPYTYNYHKYIRRKSLTRASRTAALSTQPVRSTALLRHHHHLGMIARNFRLINHAFNETPSISDARTRCSTYRIHTFMHTALPQNGVTVTYTDRTLYYGWF